MAEEEMGPGIVEFAKSNIEIEKNCDEITSNVLERINNIFSNDSEKSDGILYFLHLVENEKKLMTTHCSSPPIFDYLKSSLKGGNERFFKCFVKCLRETSKLDETEMRNLNNLNAAWFSSGLIVVGQLFANYPPHFKPIDEKVVVAGNVYICSCFRIISNGLSYLAGYKSANVGWKNCADGILIHASGSACALAASLVAGICYRGEFANIIKFGVGAAVGVMAARSAQPAIENFTRYIIRTERQHDARKTLGVSPSDSGDVIYLKYCRIVKNAHPEAVCKNAFATDDQIKQSVERLINAYRAMAEIKASRAEWVAWKK